MGKLLAVAMEEEEGRGGTAGLGEVFIDDLSLLMHVLFKFDDLIDSHPGVRGLAETGGTLLLALLSLDTLLSSLLALKSRLLLFST